MLIHVLYPEGHNPASASAMAPATKVGYNSAMQKKIGAYIKVAREKRGLSQSELARRLGVRSQTVNQWEHDKKQPSRDNVVLLARITNSTLDWLLYGKGLQEQTQNASLASIVTRERHVALVSIDRAARLEEPDQPDQVILANFQCGPRALAFALPNDSNAPDHPEGAHWIIDPDETPRPGDMVLALYGANAEAAPVYGEYRMESTATGVVVVVAPLNSRWPSARSDIGRLQVIGVMTESTRPRRR